MKSFMTKLLITVLAFITAITFVGCKGEVINAYEIAVKNGFSGTEAEWLQSLKGADGKNGNNGLDGEDARSLTIDELYTAAVEQGYSGSMLDFIGEYVGDINFESLYDNVEKAVNSNLMSVVSIFANFTIKSMTGYGQWTTSESTSGGSGVIYKLDKEQGTAYVITNYHVVYNSASQDENKISSDIKCYLYGYEFGNKIADYGITATYIGGSMDYDIALIKITESELLKTSGAKAATIGDSNYLKLGSQAIAIGNPSGDGIAANSGIICVDSEEISMTSIDETDTISFRCIRVDCPVNPGNSGGGLFNSKGELIGIVNAKIISSEVESVGYAIPVAIATRVADNIIWNCEENGNTGVKKGLLGITVTTGASKAVYNEAESYVQIIEKVQVISVDETAVSYDKIKPDDFIIAIEKDGEKLDVTRMFMVIDYMISVRPGEEITITVERAKEGGGYDTINVNLVLDDKYFVTKK